MAFAIASSPIMGSGTGTHRVCSSRNWDPVLAFLIECGFRRSLKLIVYEEVRSWLPPGGNSIACLHQGRPEPLVAEMEIERRSVARTTISKNALLFFDQQRGVFTCRVQDITNSGAGIELHSLNLLPLNFELTFDNFHTIRECRVIWRQGDFVGVAFQN